MASAFSAFLVVFVLLAASQLAASALTTTSAVTAFVKRGQPVSFNCRTDSDSKIRWEYCQPGSATASTLIYSGDRVNTAFATRISVAFDVSSGLSWLSIGAAVAEDAGTYRCSEYHTATNDLAFRLEIASLEHYSSPDAALSTLHSILILAGLLVFCITAFAILLIAFMRYRRAQHGTADTLAMQENKETGLSEGLDTTISGPFDQNPTVTGIQFPDTSASHHSSRSGSVSHTYSLIYEGNVTEHRSTTSEVAGAEEAVLSEYSSLDQQTINRERAVQPPSVYIPLENASVV